MINILSDFSFLFCQAVHACLVHRSHWHKTFGYRQCEIDMYVVIIII